MIEHVYVNMKCKDSLTRNQTKNFLVLSKVGYELFGLWTTISLISFRIFVIHMHTHTHTHILIHPHNDF